MPPELENEVVETEVVEGANDATPEAVNTPEDDSGTETPGANTPASEKTPPGAKEPEGDDAGGAGKEASEDGEETPPGAKEFKPSLKFKTSTYNKDTKEYEQKEYSIDPKFQSIIKSPEDEKLVRELHEKAFGLDAVKERYLETRQIANEIATENKTIHSQVTELRNIYQSAVQGGNLHKLDRFFEKLQVPQDVIMQYAIEKAKLAELPPEQQHAVMGKLQAEKQAEQFAQQQEQMRDQLDQQIRQTKQIQLESVMSRSDVSQVVEAFDARFGKPGAFKAAVQQAGEYAWYRSNGKVDLSPEQAVQEVIKQYGLTATGNAGAAPTANPGNGAAAGKAPVVRTDKSIPNVSGRGGSPLKSKPKNLDDLKALAKQAAQQ